MTAVSVRRDAMTTLPVTVPAHEVEIQKLIFGEDNVQVTSEDAGTVELDAATEGERLVQKYGADPVIRLYGESFKGAVAKDLSGREVAKGKTRATA